ncbi:MAG: phospho-N-acetylmuramoyl-pentapeptide-transferase [Nitrospirae bacterium]|nr:phospho-N-acetylmuramoyl-pentapeptide-transferase [Nitrospirota bacterium]
MLYYLFFPFRDIHTVFNVFRYITFRTFWALMTALILGFIIGPALIRKFAALKIGQTIRPEGPQGHASKAGTPTMGGALILSGAILSVLLWTNVRNAYVWILLLVTAGMGLVGFLDDWLKLKRGAARGLSAREKFLFQCVVAAAAAYFIFRLPNFSTEVWIPFFKNLHPDIGLWYLPFMMLIIVGTANAVNLTDGLDGLAIGPILVASLAFAVFAYVAGHSQIAEYLQVRFVRGGGEVAVFCGALFGASLSFLWYNSYPAQVFMGDVGSLALGGALGVVAIVSKQELLLPIVGGIFVVETLSVIIQVTSYKLRKKRVFRMAPFHHHLELKGWSEPKIVVRFWILSILLAVFAMSTLKVR